MSSHVPPLRAVAFDLDGLMFNTEDLYTQVAEDLLLRRGRVLDAELLRQMMGLPARVGLPLMIRWYGLEDSVEQLELETQEIFEALLPVALAPMPGLLPLLELLDGLGIPKAIATSSRRSYLERVLTLANLPSVFDFCLTAEDVVDGKPHPEIYLKAAHCFGIDASRMLVLEDSEHGCQAAVAAAAITVAVPAAHNHPSDYPGIHLRAESLQDPRVHELIRGGYAAQLRGIDSSGLLG